jgi:hypothetical protein
MFPSEQQPPSSGLADLMAQRDTTTAVLGFMSGTDVLPGIGTASSALRSAVKAALPRLTCGYRHDEPDTRCLPRLRDFPRLQHLTICTRSSRAAAMDLATEAVELGLSAHLESFALNQGDKHQIASLFSAQEWPKLSYLDLGSYQLLHFLDAVAQHHALVFPSLHSLAHHRLDDNTARKLLRLLDRGAFPALVALTSTKMPPVDDKNWMREPAIEPFSKEETDEICKVLRRLPDTDALFFGIHKSRQSFCGQARFVDADTWAPLASLIRAGGLSNLKCVPTQFGL